MGLGSSSTNATELRGSDDVLSTNFTDDEIVELRRNLFAVFPQGYLTENDFVQLYSSKYAYGDARDFSKLVFRAYDTDGDGRVEFNEFICGLSVSLHAENRMKTELAFSICDVNEGGYITAKSLMRALEVRRRGQANLDNLLLIRWLVDDVPRKIASASF